MFASRAFSWCFGSFHDVTAVDAMPLHGSLLFKDLVIFYVLYEFPVSAFLDFYFTAFLKASLFRSWLNALAILRDL